MEKIISLTAEQKRRLPEFREAWLKMGLSIDPADRPVAEQALAGIHKIVWGDEPFSITWFDSDWSMVKFFEEIISLEREQPLTRLRKCPWHQIKELVRIRSRMTEPDAIPYSDYWATGINNTQGIVSLVDRDLRKRILESSSLLDAYKVCSFLGAEDLQHWVPQRLYYDDPTSPRCSTSSWTSLTGNSQREFGPRSVPGPGISSCGLMN